MSYPASIALKRVRHRVATFTGIGGSFAVEWVAAFAWIRWQRWAGIRNTPGRSGQHAQPLYDGIKPGVVLMSDGYEVYNAIAAVRGAIHLGCWAHARRYFVEAEAAIPKAARGPESLATQFIAAIGELYAIEAQLKDLSAEQHGQQRQQLSKPVLAKIEGMLIQPLHAVTPNSLLGAKPCIICRRNGRS